MPPPEKQIPVRPSGSAVPGAGTTGADGLPRNHSSARAHGLLGKIRGTGWRLAQAMASETERGSDPRSRSLIRVAQAIRQPVPNTAGMISRPHLAMAAYSSQRAVDVSLPSSSRRRARTFSTTSARAPARARRAIHFPIQRYRTRLEVIRRQAT